MRNYKWGQGGIMNSKKSARYLISMLILEILIMMVDIMPVDMSIHEKLKFVVLTNIGMFSGTVVMLCNMGKSAWKRRREKMD